MAADLQVVALLELLAGLDRLLLEPAVENARLAALVPEVPHAVQRREREHKEELAKPEAGLAGHLLEVAKVVESRHRERHDDECEHVG